MSAKSKALDVCGSMGTEGVEGVEGPWVVLGCDTVVASPSGDILEKPVTEDEAKAHLRMLSGATHKVFTGASLMTSWGEERTWAQATDVTFRELGEAEIRSEVTRSEATS